MQNKSKSVSRQTTPTNLKALLSEMALSQI